MKRVKVPKFEIVSCPTVNLKKFDGVHDIVTGHKMSKEDFMKASETLKKLGQHIIERG